MKHDNHDSLRHDMTHVGPHDVFDDLLGQSLGQVLVQRIHEAVGSSGPMSMARSLVI